MTDEEHSTGSTMHHLKRDWADLHGWRRLLFEWFCQQHGVVSLLMTGSKSPPLNVLPYSLAFDPLYGVGQVLKLS